MDTLSDKIVSTRKEHICNACGRRFEKGTLMRTQVNVYDGIQTWRECPTCTELLSKHRSIFEEDDYHICIEFCVNDYLKSNQTPEDLLNILNKKS